MGVETALCLVVPPLVVGYCAHRHVHDWGMTFTMSSGYWTLERYLWVVLFVAYSAAAALLPIDLSVERVNAAFFRSSSLLYIIPLLFAAPAAAFSCALFPHVVAGQLSGPKAKKLRKAAYILLPAWFYAVWRINQ